MRSKKIGYLSGAPRVSTRKDAELTGPKTHILGVIRGFESLGWEVYQYIVGDQMPLSWISKGSEQNIHRGKFRVLMADIARLSLGIFHAIKAYQKLASKVDIVYERLAIFQAMGWLFKKMGKYWILETNAPLTIEAKNDRQTILLSPIAKFIEYKAYRDCDVLVCVSETLAEIIIEHTRISRDKIVIVPNAVDVSFFDPDLYKPKRLFDGFTIGFVGNIASWQGLDLLIEAVSNVIKKGYPINLVFVGDGLDRQPLEEKVHQLGISSHVRFTGFVPQSIVPEYIAGFDVGYSGQIERTERRMYCSPIKVYEYMAMEIPTIASDYDDTRKIINGESGFLFEIGNLTVLENTIIQAYQSRDSLPVMGKASRSDIINNHSWIARISELASHLENRQNN